jgi:hypothetical protein
VISDGGLILVRELDERLGLSELIDRHLSDSRRGKNIQLPLADLLRQSIYSRLAGYADVNDAARLSQDPTFRLIGSRKIWERGAALTSRLQSFETEVLTQEENLAGLAALNREWLARAEGIDSPRRIVLDMDSTEVRVHGRQEQSAYNGHFESTCYHPLLLFNREGDCLAAKLRPGNVHSADGWEELLLPEIDRQQAQGKEVAFRGDAAFAKPELYEALEEREVKYAIRLPANDNLQRKITELLTRPVGRPSHKPVFRFKSFLYQAASWTMARRVVAKVEFHCGELFPRVGFIVTNVGTSSRAVVRFYNKRGTAEQWIKESKQAVAMTMDLMEDIDPEEACAIVDPALKLMMDAAHRYDGYIVQSTGDGIFAIFGAPVAHEDHPQRALHAALRMQEDLKRYADRLRERGQPPLLVRVGVNAGEVVVRSIQTGDAHTEYTPIGHAISLASRLQTLAAPGSVVIGQSVQKFVEVYL